MLIEKNKFIFEEYLEEYGIYDEELMEYVGLRDDTPDEVKKSWEEYLEFERKNQELGLK